MTSRATDAHAALVRPMLAELPRPPHYPDDETLAEALRDGWWVDEERGTACQLKEQRGGIEIIHWLPRAKWDADNMADLGAVLLQAIRDLVAEHGLGILDLPLFGDFVGPTHSLSGRELTEEEQTRFAKAIAEAWVEFFARLGATVVVEPAPGTRGTYRARSTVREIMDALSRG